MEEKSWRSNRSGWKIVLIRHNGVFVRVSPSQVLQSGEEFTESHDDDSEFKKLQRHQKDQILKPSKAWKTLNEKDKRNDTNHESESSQNSELSESNAEQNTTLEKTNDAEKSEKPNPSEKDYIQYKKVGDEN